MRRHDAFLFTFTGVLVGMITAYLTTPSAFITVIGAIFGGFIGYAPGRMMR